MKSQIIFLLMFLLLVGCGREKLSDTDIITPSVTQLKVDNIQAIPTSLNIGEICLIKLSLNDHEGVVYKWSADQGTVYGEGQNVKYRASFASPEFTTFRCVARKVETGDSVEATVTIRIIK